jgi:hypothetical protein
LDRIKQFSLFIYTRPVSCKMVGGGTGTPRLVLVILYNNKTMWLCGVTPMIPKVEWSINNRWALPNRVYVS